ncbi:MAG: methyltransferase domain-containing protein [Spirochaetes bacterium]|nr:methyltransferase domain-containing protein [Spirochaetota bacterium]
MTIDTINKMLDYLDTIPFIGKAARAVSKAVRRIFIKEKKKQGVHYPFLHHTLTIPRGETLESLYHLLDSYRFEYDKTGEFTNYLREDFKRFLYTLSLIPPDTAGALLEIGGNPYFTSTLVKKFTKYSLVCTNFFGDQSGKYSERKSSKNDGEMVFEYYNNNIEKEELPFPPGSFDVILFCEVIEHLTMDPLYALINIHRVLKKGGTLILTTPNVNRLYNVASILAGININDTYSGYGIYGRHNREYSKNELIGILNHAGFDIETMFCSDVEDLNSANSVYSVRKILRLVKFQKEYLGKYFFIKAKKTREPNTLKPRWFYRSYDESELC